MDARIARATILVASFASLGASYRTQNFIVSAPTQQMAEQIGKQAETFRRDLAQLWLNQTLPNWNNPCPITAQVSEGLGAGGKTSFMFDGGEVFGWQMEIQGSLERVLDSVLPHEITHTIFASYFRRPLPRWADEGACTTVEHSSERSKQQQMLIQFLRTKRGIPVHSMFAMKEYPHDVLPLYAQGHSVVSFLIQQGGRQKFLNFISAGLQAEQWPAATRQFYGFDNLSELQNSWLDWVKRGSPRLDHPTPGAAGEERPQLASAAVPQPPKPQAFASQTREPQRDSSAANAEPDNLAGKMVPLSPPPGRKPAPSEIMLASNAPLPGPSVYASTEGRASAVTPAAYNPARMPYPVAPDDRQLAQAGPSNIGPGTGDRRLLADQPATDARDRQPLEVADPRAMPGPTSGGKASPSIYMIRTEQPVAAP